MKFDLVLWLFPLTIDEELFSNLKLFWFFPLQLIIWGSRKNVLSTSTKCREVLLLWSNGFLCYQHKQLFQAYVVLIKFDKFSRGGVLKSDKKLISLPLSMIFVVVGGASYHLLLNEKEMVSKCFCYFHYDKKFFFC